MSDKRPVNNRCPKLDIWRGHKETQVAINANYCEGGWRIICQRREGTGRQYSLSSKLIIIIIPFNVVASPAVVLVSEFVSAVIPSANRSALNEFRCFCADLSESSYSQGINKFAYSRLQLIG